MAQKPKRKVETSKSTRRPRGTGAAFVYDHLRENILNLTLAPGTLLDETTLSKDLSISRSPIREALIRLSAEGLVRTLPNRSSIVSFFDINEILSYFDSLDLLYRITAKLAARYASQEDVETIFAAAQAHHETRQARDPARLIQTNRAFHIAIARAAKNSYFEAWLETLLDDGQRILGLYMRHLGDEELTPDPDVDGTHFAICEAIKAGNENAAEEAAKRDAKITNEELTNIFNNRDIDLSVAGSVRDRFPELPT